MGFGILNTVGMYQSKKMTVVPVIIKNGQIQNPEVLRIGDMLLFAGSDSGREYAGYVGHVEMVYEITGNTITLCGHSSGRPSTKKMTTYCKSRYNAKTNTRLGNKGLIKVVRFLWDPSDATEIPEQMPEVPSCTPAGNIIVTGSSVNVRYGAWTSYGIVGRVHLGDRLTSPNTDGWKPVEVDNKVRWMSAKHLSEKGFCTGNSVNIRSGPSTDYARVSIANRGDKMKVVDTDGWIPVVMGKDVWWISGKYAKIET